jgi:hypothetical protein
MKRILTIITILSVLAVLASCYKNRYDLTDTTLSSLTNVSFRDDVVPIIVSGNCGCHANGSTRQVAFAHLDTIFYSAILSRSAALSSMANGGAHPGEGSIFFTPSQAAIIKAWVAQGAKDNYVAPPVTGSVGYAANIVPIYRTACKGSTCHGGLAITLDYTSLKNAETTISTMMASQGSSGHPGGALSLDGTTTATFLAWISQGYKQ